MTLWDRAAKRFDTAPPTPEEDEAVRRTMPHLSAEQDVLEIGCAAGATAETLAPHVGSWHGLDISAEMIRRATARGVEGATFQQGVLADLDGQRDRYDVVIAYNVLHFMDLPADLDRIARLLRPRGLFIAQTPCLKDLKPLARAFLPVVAFVLRIPALSRMRFGEIRAMVGERFEVLDADGSRPVRTWMVARKA